MEKRSMPRRLSHCVSLGGVDDESEINDLDLDEKSTEERDFVKETRAVVCLRMTMMVTLIAAASTAAGLTFRYVRSVQNSDFETQYYDSVVKLAEGFQNGVNTKAWTAKTFSALYTSRYGPLNPWPNATLAHFQEQAAGQLQLSSGRALSFNPIITGENRAEWEAHASESVEILGAPSLIERATPESRIVADGIYRKQDGVAIDDPGISPESRYNTTMIPVWQIAPIVTNEKAVMFNLHAETNRQRALDDMMTYKVPALTSILQLVQDSELRPSSILFYPVFDTFDEGNVVGSISIVFSWDVVFTQILPNYIRGMICVLETNTNQEYTFSITGDDVTILGEGDLHDGSYEDMKVNVNASLEGTDAILGEVDNMITYNLRIYPSQEFKSQYVTKKPALYTLGVLLIFFFTSAAFMLYDYIVQHRQNVVMQAAIRSSRIVDSLFPAVVRDRLFTNNEQARSNEKTNKLKLIPRKLSMMTGTVVEMVGETPATRLKKFFNTSPTTDKQYDLSDNIDKEAPIADMFPSTTIMFADIAGFTSWSSAREPSQVFRLLEALFKEFDQQATKLGVFKVETIGDCYVAVSGLPDPRDDHAVVMARFAIKCQEKFHAVTKKLSSLLGPETNGLMLRSGLHSGPVTAGVLRGQKSRFQLFGDTMNTSSRMESTGQPKRIQISQETADLLREAGKESWFTPREELVTAKGKGTLQTYWLIPKAPMKSEESKANTPVVLEHDKIAKSMEKDISQCADDIENGINKVG